VSQEPLRVEFRVELGNRRPVPKPEPGAKAEIQRVDRAARRARNLALAYWIDGLVRSGEVADLATVARMCGISRARVSAVIDILAAAPSRHESLLNQTSTPDHSK
jgi:hypothetical protein